MAERAHVASLEVIEAFRARLIVFMSKARAALEEISDEVQRSKDWLENDRRPFWERECRRRRRELEEAQQELFSAKLSGLRTETAAQLLAVDRAQRSLRQAEEKREITRRWIRELENRAEPLGKQVDQLLTFLTSDLAKGAVYLGHVIRILERYAAAGAVGPEPVSVDPANSSLVAEAPENTDAPPPSVRSGEGEVQST